MRPCHPALSLANQVERFARRWTRHCDSSLKLAPGLLLSVVCGQDPPKIEPSIRREAVRSKPQRAAQERTT